jgi:hypothetical protein
MAENIEQSQQEQTSTTPETPQNIELGDALAGVFTEPGDTFAAVKQSTKKNYWLVPMIVVIVVSILATLMVLRDEELTAGIQEKQMKAIKERLDKAVKEGKMTQEEANQQIEQSQKFMTGQMMMIFGLIFSVFGVLLFFFVKALIYWGGLKLFRGNATYVDVLNVLGLSGIIVAIQLVVDTVLAVITGRILVNIGPVLLVNEASVGTAMYTFLANFDLINIWYLIVVGIGLAKASNLKTSLTVPFVLVLWLLWVALTVFGPLKFIAGG